MQFPIPLTGRIRNLEGFLCGVGEKEGKELTRKFIFKDTKTWQFLLHSHRILAKIIWRKTMSWWLQRIGSRKPLLMQFKCRGHHHWSQISSNFAGRPEEQRSATAVAKWPAWLVWLLHGWCTKKSQSAMPSEPWLQRDALLVRHCRWANTSVNGSWGSKLWFWS